jgi:serine/threonine protein kinase
MLSTCNKDFILINIWITIWINHKFSVTNTLIQADQIINNKYIVKSKLKSGGFGAVYFAKDIQDDKKFYAIKFTPIETKNYA